MRLALTTLFFLASTAQAADTWLITCKPTETIVFTYNIGEAQTEVCLKADWIDACWTGVSQETSAEAVFYEITDRDWLLQRYHRVHLKGDKMIWMARFVLLPDGTLNVLRVKMSDTKASFDAEDWSDHCTMVNAQRIIENHPEYYGDTN